jgi:hypothetical protein
MKPKIFCIGFHKTGTSSLGKALRALDYRVKGPFGVKLHNIEQIAFQRACHFVPMYDAFQDNPWPLLYRELDAEFPDSKFILMQRDPDSWLKSSVKHFGKEETPMRRWIYGVGSPQGNEDIYLTRYNTHNQDVIEYFRGRSDDLLIMDLSKGDGWDKLCPFLGAVIPEQDFPHINRALDREQRGQ